MRTDGSLIGIRWGPASAIQPQPRRRRKNEVWVGAPTRPWGSRRLPAMLLASGPRRTTFRELLRRSEGVPVSFPDGSGGIVREVVFGPLGFDFWPVALVVETAGGRRRVPTAAIGRIDVRKPRLWVDGSAEPLERGRRVRHERDRHEQRLGRLQRRHDLLQEQVLARRHRQKAKSPVGRR